MSVLRLDGLRGGAGVVDLGDLVSAEPFATRAALDATSAEDGKLALLETPTSGEPRLFVRSGGAWVPAGDRLWEVATTGAGVMSGLIDAAGDAVYPGDLGVDGNGTVYYAAGSAGRCVFVPRAIAGGIIIGETHTAELAALWYKEDPSTATDVADLDSPGAASISYDSGTGKTTIQASASDLAYVRIGDPQSSYDLLYGGLIDAVWTGSGATGNGIVDLRFGNTSPYPRTRLLAGTDGEYNLQQAAIVDITGADASVEHDISILGDGTSYADVYYNNPSPAQDEAVPASSQSVTEAPTTTGGSPLLVVFPLGDASLPSVTLAGAFAIAIEAIP